MTDNRDKKEKKKEDYLIEDENGPIHPDDVILQVNAKNMNDPDARIFDEMHQAIHTQQGTVRPDSLLPVDAPEGSEQKTKADDYSDLEGFRIKKPDQTNSEDKYDAEDNE